MARRWSLGSRRRQRHRLGDNLYVVHGVALAITSVATAIFVRSSWRLSFRIPEASNAASSPSLTLALNLDTGQWEGDPDGCLQGRLRPRAEPDAARVVRRNHPRRNWRCNRGAGGVV